MSYACRSLLVAPIPAHYNLTDPPDGMHLVIDKPNLIPQAKHVIDGVEYELKNEVLGHTLYWDHPITLYLKAKHPEIPAERWERPFMWSVVNDFGLNAERMDSLFVEAGLQGEDSSNLINLVTNGRRGDWTKLLQHVYSEHAPWPGILKDVMVLGTGAHWPGNFGVSILRDAGASISMYSAMASVSLVFQLPNPELNRTGRECPGHVRRVPSHPDTSGQVKFQSASALPREQEAINQNPRLLESQIVPQLWVVCLPAIR